MSKSANHIKQLRNAVGMSQTELAQAMGTSRSNIAMWESGERLPGCSTLSKLSKLFDVSIDYIIGISEKRRNNSTLDDTIDLGRLNCRGIEMLHEMYAFLLSQKKYTDKKYNPGQLFETDFEEKE